MTERSLGLPSISDGSSSRGGGFRKGPFAAAQMLLVPSKQFLWVSNLIPDVPPVSESAFLSPGDFPQDKEPSQRPPAGTWGQGWETLTPQQP